MFFVNDNIFVGFSHIACPPSPLHSQVMWTTSHMFYVNGSAFALLNDTLSFPAISYTYTAPYEWWNVNGTESWQHAADVSGITGGVCV